MNTLLYSEAVDSEPPIACKREAGAFTVQQKTRYQFLRQQLREKLQTIVELPDGYALQLPADTSTIMLAAEFVTLERRCCDFFHFHIDIEPKGGPLRLELTGNQHIKGFLEEELATL